MSLRAIIAAFVAVACAGPAPESVQQVRFGTFNVSMSRADPGVLVEELSGPGSAHARAIAEIIQRVRPDVLLLNEFDYDDGLEALDLFRTRFLAMSQNGAEPIAYGYAFCAPVNTGVPSGFDLDRDGTTGGPDDSLGYGSFPGAYGMVVLSRYPILEEGVRTFRQLPWRAMPGARMPVGWYPSEVVDALPLSSKSHQDVPILIGEHVVHFLVSHPTPPVFDGAEDRNGRRNHDEIRFWVDYVSDPVATWIRDDRGGTGGLPEGASFVIAGDLNADPSDGEATEAIARLLGHPRVQSEPVPRSVGGAAAAAQGGANHQHRGDPAYDTADFGDDLPGHPGNLRVDYVLPSTELTIVDGGVFWPPGAHPAGDLVGYSDHRLVWIDVSVR